MVAFELEVMAKKMDRFGWDRERGEAAHDRIVTDWMDALKDYPLGEVQDACREWIVKSPRKMPNEGDIVALIQAKRRASWMARKATLPPEPEPERKPADPETVAAILKQAGIAPKRMRETE